jgi:hypothetical protein
LGDLRNRSATSPASESLHRKGMRRRPLLQREGTKGQAHIPSHEQAVEVEAGLSLERFPTLIYLYPVLQHILSEANCSKLAPKATLEKAADYKLHH